MPGSAEKKKIISVCWKHHCKFENIARRRQTSIIAKENSPIYSALLWGEKEGETAQRSINHRCWITQPSTSISLFLLCLHLLTGRKWGRNKESADFHLCIAAPLTAIKKTVAAIYVMLNYLLIHKFSQGSLRTSISDAEVFRRLSKSWICKRDQHWDESNHYSGSRWCSIHDLIIVLPFCKSSSAGENTCWIWAFTNSNLETLQCDRVSYKTCFPAASFHQHMRFGRSRTLGSVCLLLVS